MSVGRPMSPEMPKTRFDVEMGKRQAVDAEEFEDMHNQMESVGHLERCGTQSRYTSWDQKSHWEITRDMHRLVAEFGMEHGAGDAERIHGSH
ncbi:hypothetical protein Acr_06g0016700 [Actinidia rufa]|uniref:Uncharacterized protein n=1 Tax=Actinidia rufa TaxID=165716 RepID=A0A7J0ETR6_9ERIC|nr:hypothetical protein Acr_06g0016700 [Actinidia rufa]